MKARTGGKRGIKGTLIESIVIRWRRHNVLAHGTIQRICTVATGHILGMTGRDSPPTFQVQKGIFHQVSMPIQMFGKKLAAALQGCRSNSIGKGFLSPQE
jgi:hypothetical protein